MGLWRSTLSRHGGAMLLFILILVVAAAAGVLGDLLEIAAWLVALMVLSGALLAALAYWGIKRFLRSA